jgi:hypothetical protein
VTTSETSPRLLAGSMTAAAVCLVLGHLWNTPSTLPAADYVNEVTQAHGRFTAATLLTSIAAVLLAPAAYGIGRLAGERSPRLAAVGATLAAAGAAGLAVGASTIGFTMGMLTAHDPALARKVYDMASADAFIGVPFYLAPLFTVGMLVLAAALIRTRATPLWQPVLLVVAAVAAFGAPAGGVAGAAGHAPLAVALVAFAVMLWRGGRVVVGQPAASPAAG